MKIKKRLIDKKYYCKDCGKQVHWQTTLYGLGRCHSCAKIGNQNSSKSKYNITKEVLIKEYITKKKSMRQMAKIMKCNWFTIRYKLIKYKIPLRNRSEINSGKGNPMFAKSSPHGKWGEYKGICMRSSWEIAYAKYLDQHNIKWKYEPKRFYLGELTYCPDFYLPENDMYIEIKGYWRGNTKKQFELFKKKYPKENIKLLMEKDLQNLGILKK